MGWKEGGGVGWGGGRGRMGMGGMVGVLFSLGLEFLPSSSISFLSSASIFVWKTEGILAASVFFLLRF